MTTTVRHTDATEWAEVTKALEVVRKDVRRDVQKLQAQASGEREQLEKSLRGIVEVLEQGLTAAAKRARDPQLRKDIAQVGRAIRSALRKSAPRASRKVTKPATPGPTAKGSGPKAARSSRPPKRPARKG